MSMANRAAGLSGKNVEIGTDSVAQKQNLIVQSSNNDCIASVSDHCNNLCDDIEDDAITDYNFKGIFDKVPLPTIPSSKIDVIRQRLYNITEPYHPLKNIEDLLKFNEDLSTKNFDADNIPNKKMKQILKNDNNMSVDYVSIIDEDEEEDGHMYATSSTSVIEKSISNSEYLEFKNAIILLKLDDDEYNSIKLEDSFVFAFFTFILRWSRESMTSSNSALLNALIWYLDTSDVSLTLRHPKNPRYQILPTAFKFLQLYKENRQLFHQSAIIHSPISLPLKKPITEFQGIVHRLIHEHNSRYNYNTRLLTFYKKMEIIVNSFISESWTETSLNLLTNTEYAPFEMHLSENKLHLENRNDKIECSTNTEFVAATKPKYVTGTACCGKTTLLNALKTYGGWCTPSREDLGTFSGKSPAPAYIVSLHAALDFVLNRFRYAVIGDRGPIDNFIWSAIMPLCREKYVKVALDAFIEILDATLNEFSIAYFSNFDTLVFVDPYSSRVQKRMLTRSMDGDQHRGRIPFYAYTQNVAYTLLAHLFGWNIVTVPYQYSQHCNYQSNIGSDIHKIDEEAFKQITLSLVHRHYGQANQSEVVEAEKIIQTCTKLQSIKVPPILTDASFQKIIGIHK